MKPRLRKHHPKGRSRVLLAQGIKCGVLLLTLGTLASPAVGLDPVFLNLLKTTGLGQTIRVARVPGVTRGAATPVSTGYGGDATVQGGPATSLKTSLVE